MQNMQQMKRHRPEETINLLHFLRALWRRMWVVVLVTVMFAGGTYLYSCTALTPVYRSGFTSYVNNKMEIDSMGSTTVSDLNTSYALAYTYESIITSRSVITEAVDLCRRNGTYPAEEQISYSISTSVAERAPVISVFVETPDAEFARDLAKAIAQVAPKHVERVVEGSSMRIIDEPMLQKTPSAPDHLQNVLFGASVGLLVSCLGVVALEFYLDKVQNSEDLEKRYEIPVLGSIPDIERVKKTGNRVKVNGGR